MSRNQTWRKSSYSDSKSACVELALGRETTAVRDTESRARGHLTFGRVAFDAFLSEVRTGHIDGKA